MTADRTKRIEEISAQIDAIGFQLEPVSTDQLQAQMDRLRELEKELRGIYAEIEADRSKRA